MATGYRHSGKKMPVVSASGAINSGALVWQEGTLGVAIIDADAGASLELDTKGVWVLPVPATTVKGDALYANLSAESTGLTLTKTATGATFIGRAAGDRDAAGNGLVHLVGTPLVPQP